MRDLARDPRVILRARVQLAAGGVVEADLQTRWWVLGDEDEVCCALAELRCEIRGGLEGTVNALLEARRAVVDPAQRELEAVPAPAALQRQVGQIPDLAAIGVLVEEVACGECVRLVELSYVGTEEKGTRHWYSHHLVRVDGERIREVGTGHFIFQLLGEDGWPAP